MENQPNKEQQLWEEARERVKFKRKVMTYLAFSAFFWIIWYLNGAQNYGIVPWPAWAMLGWGIGLVFRYLRIYHSSTDAVDKEYQRMKNDRGL